MNISPKERLRQIFENTIDSGIPYSGKIDEIDFYSLLCKATSNNQLYRLLGCNLSMFNYKYENDESILMIFSIPSSVSLDKVPNQENKHISEKIMDILQLVEECFITLDFMDLKNIKEDKFVYMTVIKKIKEDE